MLAFTHHVIWSFLSFMPVTKVDICVFDSEQRGNSIIPFLDFRKRSPETFDQKIYTSQEAMYARLQKINAQIERIYSGQARKSVIEIFLITIEIHQTGLNLSHLWSCMIFLVVWMGAVLTFLTSIFEEWQQMWSFYYHLL